MTQSNLGIQISAQGVAATVKDIDSASEALDRLGKKGGEASGGTSLAVKAVGAFAGLGAAKIAIGAIAGTATDLAGAMLDAQIKAENLKIGLSFAIAGKSAAEIEYLRQTTNKLGLQFESSAQAYMKFAAASRETRLEGDGARKVFESVSKASTVMGLSANDTSGVLLALSQMISKGTVQSEELRGQLGERMPGAFQIAARSMGVTTAQLGKMLEAGEVLAEDFLPKFAAQLERELGGSAEKAAQRTEAAVNRVTNAWARLKETTAQAGPGEFAAGQMTILGDAMDGVSEAMLRAKDSGSGFAGQMTAAAGQVALFLNPFNALGYSAQSTGGKLQQAEARLKELKDELARGSGDIFLQGALKRAQALVDKLREAQAAKEGLSRQDAASFRAGDNATLSALDKQQQADTEELVRVRLKLSGVSEDYVKTLTKLDAMHRRGSISTKDYTTLVSELAKQNSKLDEAATKAGDAFKHQAEEGAKLEQSLKNQKDGIDPEYQKKLYDLAAAAEQYGWSIDRLVEAEHMLWEAQPKQKAAAEALRKAYDDAAKAAQSDAEAMLDAQRKLEEAAKQSMASQLDRINAMQDEEVAAELARTTNLSLAQAIEAVAIARLREKADRAKNDGNDAQLASINAEIAAREKLMGMIGSREAQDANKLAADSALMEWRRVSDGFVEAMMGGVDGLKRYLKSSLENMLIRVPLQAVMNGVGGAMFGGGAAGSGLSNLSSMFSIGNAFSNGGMFASAGATIFGNGAAYGAALGTTSIGAGSQAAMLAAQTGEFGAAGFSATAAAAGSEVLASLAAAAPYVAAFIAVASLVAKESTPHVGGYAAADAAGNVSEVTKSLAGSNDFMYQVMQQVQPETQKAVEAIAGSLSNTLNLAASTFSGGSYGVKAGFASDNDDGSRGYLSITKDGQQVGSGIRRDFASDPAKGLSEYATATAQEARAVLEQMDLPGWAQDALSQIKDGASADTLNAFVREIVGVQTSIDEFRVGVRTLGVSFAEVASLSDEAIIALSEAAGGMDVLKAGIKDYYSNFFSAEEQAAISAKAISAELGKVNISVGDSVEAINKLGKEGFRELVEKAAGRGDTSALAALYRVSGAFAGLITPLEDASDGVEKVSATTTAAARALQEAAAAMQEVSTYAAQTKRLTPGGSAASGTPAEYGFDKNGNVNVPAWVMKVAQTQADGLPAFSGMPSYNVADRMANYDSMGLGSGYRQALLNGAFYAGQNEGPPQEFAQAGSSPAQDEWERKREQREQDRIDSEKSLIDALDSLEASFDDYLQSLTQGDLSNLSPEAKYADAKATFEATAKAAMMGDGNAAEHLREAADNLLKASRGYNASGDAYSLDFSEVVQVMSGTNDLLKRLEDATRTGTSVQADGLVRIDQTLADGNGLAARMAKYESLRQVRYD